MMTVASTVAESHMMLFDSEYIMINSDEIRKLNINHNEQEISTLTDMYNVCSYSINWGELVEKWDVF